GWGPRVPLPWPPSRSSPPPAPSPRASGWWSSRPVIPRTMSERPSIRRMERFLGELVATGVFSSVVGLVATVGEIVWEGAAGEARAGAPAETATRFDYASLTKPF